MKRLLLSALLFLCSLYTLSAQSQGGYEIPSRHIDIQIKEDGSIDFAEQIDVNFSEQRRGIFRSIPYIYDLDSQRVQLRITDIDVEDHNYKVYAERGTKKIRIGQEHKYLTGDHKYKLSYSVEKGIVSYANHDELYWNLVDFDTDANTKKASFKIIYPKDWLGKLQEYRAFSGQKGSVESDIVIHHSDNELVGAMPSGLRPFNGITLALKIPKGLLPESALIHATTIVKKSKYHWLFSFWNLIPLTLGGLLLYFYQRIERDERITNIPLRYHAPDGMTPAEVGTFIDHTANRRDVISLLPYWGNQGLIKIQPVEGAKDDMYFYKLKDLPDTSLDYEATLFYELFIDGDVVLLSDLKEKFYQATSTTAQQVKQAVMDRPLFDETSKKIFHSNWMILIAVLIVILGIVITVNTDNFLVLVGMIFIAVCIVAIHVMQPRLSENGRRVKTHLEGLKNFLENPATQKMQELIDEDPDYIHKMYPYVLAFDLDQTWARLESQWKSVHPPIWYDYTSTNRSGRPFSYGSIKDTLDVRSIEKVFYSTPPPQNNSRGGGGFSGGSAGGGFGGGSTGSW